MSNADDQNAATRSVPGGTIPARSSSAEATVGKPAMPPYRPPNPTGGKEGPASSEGSANA